jgi:hypothetical protein
VLPRHTRTRGVTAVTHDNVHELANQLDIIQKVAAEELEDLRTLARGIYPRHLHQQGPASALWSLARSSLVTIQVNDEGADACRRQSKQRCTSALVRRFQNTAKSAPSLSTSGRPERHRPRDAGTPKRSHRVHSQRRRRRDVS